MSELKKCPFCGGAPTEVDWGADQLVSCFDCEVAAKAPTAEEAADIWNTRPLEGALQAQLDEMTHDKRRLEQALSRIGFYLAGTENHFISEKILHVLGGGTIDAAIAKQGGAK